MLQARERVPLPGGSLQTPGAEAILASKSRMKNRVALSK
jgi:hypothetical protein